MRRRAVLASFLLTTVSGCASNELLQDSGASISGDISNLEWTDDQTWLELYFEADHNTEYFWLTHAADSTIIYASQAPRFEGPVSVPILDALACDNADYPSSTFEITAAKGRPMLSHEPETTGKAELDLPEDYLNRLTESEYYGDDIRCDAIREGYHPDQ